MTDLELAEEIERRVLGKWSVKPTIYFDEIGWREIIAALRRGSDVTFSSGNEEVKWTPSDVARLDKALSEAFPERPPSGEMVMGLRVIVNPEVPADEVWITNAHGKRLGTIVNLSAAEASKEAK